jgi:hypothetical protein
MQVVRGGLFVWSAEMAPRRNECLDIATEELVEAGVPFDVSYGGKHLLLRFHSFAGEPQLVTLSKNGDASPHSYAWIKTNVRRKLRAPKKERADG